MSKLYVATAILIGTMIGAGFLGIPYVAMKSGFLIAFVEMFLVASVLFVIMLYFGKLVVRTKGVHQFTGYAEMYLGKVGKWIMFFAFAFGMYSTILAYLVGEGQSLSFLFFGHNGYELYFGILTWVVLSFLTYIGLKALEEEESFGVLIVFLLIGLIIIVYGWQINLANISTSYPSSFFVPAGVIVFAFLAFSSIPLLKEIIGDDEKTMRNSIILAHIIVFVAYSAFTLVVLGYKGTGTPEVATLSLGKLFVLLGALTMFNSYFGSSIILRDTWVFDWKLSRAWALFWTVSPCLLLFLLVEFANLNSFTGILNVGAWISGGFMGLLLVYMLVKSRKILFNSH